MKVIIVGGVAGGATTAARLRRMDEKAQIILFERGKYISYANCGLPYYIGGVITNRNKLLVQTVSDFTTRYGIDVRIQSEVTRINPEKKTVEVSDLVSGKTYTEPYDKLVLATGAEPFKPPIKGIDNPLIFTLRSISDTDHIKNYISGYRPRRAVVVGGGFIGLEMAENLHHNGMDVTIIEMSDQVMAPVDFSMASIVHEHLQSKNVQLLLNERVTGFQENGHGISVALQSEKLIETDMVIWSIGVRPDTGLAKNAGLSIGSLGGISVNDYMQTSDPDIYAVGDAVEVLNPVTGKHVLVPLAGPANKQGRIVADNIVSGNHQKYRGTIGTSIAKVFDLTVAASGIPAKMLKKEGIDYRSSYTQSFSHAGYYPQALPLVIKIIFTPDEGRLLGAQVVGYDGVDKRIEMLGMVIAGKGTIYDLMQIEQAYAPPYSSAKDPVNMAGYVAENILNDKIAPIHWREIKDLDPDKVVLLDVRTKAEFDAGAIPGSVHIPVDDLRARLEEIPRDKPVVIYCAAGMRGYLAGRILLQNGFSDVRNLLGGYKIYSTAMSGLE